MGLKGSRQSACLINNLVFVSTSTFRYIPTVDQTNGRECQPVSLQRPDYRLFKSCDTAEGATPATAQAQELLAQANLESVG
jgi:hypothetical protein